MDKIKAAKRSNKKRKRGEFIVERNKTYYLFAGDQRFYMSRARVSPTNKTGSTYNGTRPPWEFDYWMSCYDTKTEEQT